MIKLSCFAHFSKEKMFSPGAHRGWLRTCDFCYNCCGGCCPKPERIVGSIECLNRQLQEPIQVNYCSAKCLQGWKERQRRLHGRSRVVLLNKKNT